MVSSYHPEYFRFETNLKSVLSVWPKEHLGLKSCKKAVLNDILTNDHVLISLAWCPNVIDVVEASRGFHVLLALTTSLEWNEKRERTAQFDPLCFQSSYRLDGWALWTSSNTWTTILYARDRYLKLSLVGKRAYSLTFQGLQFPYVVIWAIDVLFNSPLASTQ